MLYVFIEILNLFTLFFLSLCHFFNGSLHILSVLSEFLEPLLQTYCFFLNDFTVLLVNFLQALELVVLVATAKHGAF